MGGDWAIFLPPNCLHRVEFLTGFVGQCTTNEGVRAVITNDYSIAMVGDEGL